MTVPERPILIAGPTASGKSSLALGLAEYLGGWVVNVDSMQVYDGWNLLTARPSADDVIRVPHRLYGHVDPASRYSAGQWLRDVEGVLAESRDAGIVPILVGGTGLNFKALTHGLSQTPPIDATIRDATNALLNEVGADRMRSLLIERDPKAATLDIVNPRRIVRAWEVLEQTGRSLTAWNAETPPPLLPRSNAHLLVLEADRDTLVERIERRFITMIDQGVLDEVDTMAARGLDPELPAMKAVGAPPLFAYRDGRLTLEAAITKAQTDTRRYAKRQRTWLRNQMLDWPRLPIGASVEDALATIAQASPSS